MLKELSRNQLRRSVNSNHWSCETVSQLKPLQTIIGQQRAVKALQLGLGIRSQGFNIYVSGYAGTGKLTAVKRYITELAKPEEKPGDWCYVHNFENTYEPKRLLLPSGRGKEFREDMKSLVEEAKQSLVKTFESEESAKKREEIFKEAERKKVDIFSKVDF